MRLPLIIILSLLSLMLFQGCGQKGALYLPQPSKAVTKK